MKLECLQTVLDEMVSKNFVAGANCLVLHQGKELAYYEAGYADLDTKQEIKRDSIFRLYSMTKPITAAAAMLLLEEGKIDLLDSVGDYIPSFRNQKVCLYEAPKGLVDAQRPVNLHDLLSMTSGLVYCGDGSLAEIETTKVFEEMINRLYEEDAMTTLEFADRIGKAPLAFQPGEKWQYGSSADILGAVIEVASGMTLGEFLRKRFFEPLGMKDTAFYVPEDKRDRFTKVYMDSAEGLVPYLGHNLGIMNDMAKAPAFESGGAGLVSTIDDYAAFATMLLQGGTYKGVRILASKTVEYLTTATLNKRQESYMEGWLGLAGYSYGNLMRIMTEPNLAIFNASKGEYGWDGWLGAYFVNDPANELTFLMMQQKKDSGTTSYTRKLRNVLAASLDEA